MTTDATPPGDERQPGDGAEGPDPWAASSQATPAQWVRWALRKIGLILLGVLVLAITTGIFSQAPQWHSQTLTWIAVGILSLIALVAWIRSERGRDG